MKRLHLLVALHHHQPVGASPVRVDEAFTNFYEPLLHLFDEVPSLRLSLHYSGALLEWISIQRPVFLDRLASLIEGKRVEMLGGAFYDPILGWLTERDAIGQIRLTDGWIRSRLGAVPTGVWLPEQAWDPALPRLLGRAGAKYTFVSERTFRAGRSGDDRPAGYYVTEREGHALAVFPIDQPAAQLIGAEPAGKAIGYLETLALDEPEEGPPVTRALTFAASVEQVSMEHLGELFAEISGNEAIHMMPVGEYLELAPASGRVYLPTPTDPNHFLSRFLVEFPESNWMLQRVQRVSQLVSRAMGGDHAVEAAGMNPPDMLRNLWRATSHDAYWPSGSGGIFASALRQANYANLLRAEQVVEDHIRSRDDHLEHDWIDLDKDGQDELEVTGQYITAYIKPSYGGAMPELDFKDSYFNVLNTMRRLGDAQVDTHPRWSFMDHLLAAGATLDEFYDGRHRDAAHLSDIPYRVVATDFSGTKGAGVVHLAATIEVDEGWIEVEKSYIFSRRSPSLALRYRLTNSGDTTLKLWFGTELNLNIGSGDDGFYYEVPEQTLGNDRLSGIGAVEDAAGLNMVNELDSFRVRLRFDPATLWWYPLETVQGIDRAYQGSCILPSWKLALEPQQSVSRSIRMAFQSGDA